MKRLHDERANEFIGFLLKQQGPSGRANLAELRRAASDPLGDYRSIRILGDYLPNTDDWPFDAYRLTATLFALYATKFWDKSGRLDLPPFNPKEKRRSLGASLRRLKQQLGPGQDSLDLRFSTLLDARREDLAVLLRAITQRIAATHSRIPVDFNQLLHDLLNWNDDRTRRNWAMDYWQSASQEDEPGSLLEEPTSQLDKQV